MKRIEKTFHIIEAPFKETLNNFPRGTKRKARAARFTGVVIAAACIWMHLLCCPVQALESGSYRLLSISETEKLVLISRIPDQKKFLLDAADVKVVINDKPAEFGELTLFTVVRVQMDLKKNKKKGVNIDGQAREITVSDPVGK